MGHDMTVSSHAMTEGGSTAGKRGLRSEVLQERAGGPDGEHLAGAGAKDAG